MREIGPGEHAHISGFPRTVSRRRHASSRTLGRLCAGQAQEPDAVNGPVGEAALFQEVPSVTAASKYEQDPREAPASISVITRDQIQRFGYRTLGEALNSVRGFFTSYDRNYTYVAVRGLHASRGLQHQDPAAGGWTPAQRQCGRRRLFRDRVGHRPHRGRSRRDHSRRRVLALRHQRLLRRRQPDYPERALAAGRGGPRRRGHVRVVPRARACTAGVRRAESSSCSSGGFYRSSGPNLYFPEFDSPATNNGMAVGLDGDRTADAFGKLTYQGWSFEAGVQGRRRKSRPPRSRPPSTIPG